MSYLASLFERKSKYHFVRVCSLVTSLNSLKLDETVSVHLEKFGFFDGHVALARSNDEEPIIGHGHYRMVNDKMAVGIILTDEQEKGFRIGDVSVTGPDFVRKASTVPRLVGVKVDDVSLKKLKEDGFFDGSYIVKEVPKKPTDSQVIYQSTRGIFVTLPACQLTLLFAAREATTSCQDVFTTFNLGVCPKP